MTPRCEHALFLHECFSTLRFILSAVDGKIKQHVYIKFCVKLGKSTTDTLVLLREIFGEHSLSRNVVFQWHSRFEASQVSADDD
jgi:hypothetical protein